MGNRIEYKRFFVISESGKKYFNTDFSSCLNLIHGKNTSGKSTLIQAIQYTFGINSEKKKLEEVLSEQVIFRIDFELLKNDNHPEIISIIRSDEILIIKREDQPLIKFNGIGADNSQEHIKLKKYLADLCGFNLLIRIFW
jgi:DNA repair exonuclease SbcCD ATPase subunit